MNNVYIHLPQHTIAYNIIVDADRYVPINVTLALYTWPLKLWTLILIFYPAVYY